MTLPVDSLILTRVVDPIQSTLMVIFVDARVTGLFGTQHVLSAPMIILKKKKLLGGPVALHVGSALSVVLVKWNAT